MAGDRLLIWDTFRRLAHLFIYLSNYVCMCVLYVFSSLRDLMLYRDLPLEGSIPQGVEPAC